MRSRSVALAISVSVLTGAGAVWAAVHAHQLRTEANWLMQRGSAQAEEYADTLDASLAEQQLATFDHRRDVLEGAERWQRLEMLAILACVVSGFSSYALFLFRRLREQLIDATAHLDESELDRAKS